MSLDFELAGDEDAAVLALTGRIDREAGSVLDQAYTAAIVGAPALIQLDFTGVDYINSTGIALIVSVLARARAQGLPIRAVGLSPHYVHIFDITRLSDFIEIVQPFESLRSQK